jgi:hypothetical protein
VPRHAQCAALTDLAAATVLARWTRADGWLTAAPHCAWFGVTCDAAGDVTALELDMNSLGGRLPESLGDLTALRTLCVAAYAARRCLCAAVACVQTVHACVADDAALRPLCASSMRYNGLHGSLPTALGRLTALERLCVPGSLHAARRPFCRPFLLSALH